MSEHATITVKRSYAYAPEKLFDAWMEPATASRWLFCTPEGRNVRCDIDARPGGAFVITDRRAGDDVEHHGTYVEVDRPRRLVFAFGVPKYSNAVSTVTITIAADAGTSEMTLAAEGVPAEWASQTEQGWRDLLAKLDDILGQAK